MPSCPKCRYPTMQYYFSKPGVKINKCNKCGCEVAVVDNNRQNALKGTYITSGGLDRVDEKQ